MPLNAAPTRDFLQRLPLAENRPALAYLAAAAIVTLAFALRLLLNPVLPPGYPYLTFFPAVMLVTFLFGRSPGIIAAIVCGLLAWFYFIPPYNSLVLDGRASLALAFYTAIVSIDIALIHWMQRAYRLSTAAQARSRMLADRAELLFRELQHRVSNNLQVVSALVALQRRNVADPAARAALDDAARRLGLIGRIQRRLYDPAGESLPLPDFLRQFATDTVESAGREGVTCTVRATQEDVTLAQDALIPVALIVAESIANAIEHGFAGRERGHVEVGVEADEGTITIAIADDGAGMKPGFAMDDQTSLGLTIAVALARKLGGDYALEPRAGGGTLARLTLPREAG